MNSNGIQSYRKTNVMTANPKRLIIMCYEGAIENLKISKQKYIEQDYDGRSKALSKAQDIINELVCALDFEKGGAIAMSLDSLYNYMLRRIIHADVNKDVTPIDEIIGMLYELKSAWEEVLYKPGNEIEPEAAGYHGETRQQAQIL